MSIISRTTQKMMTRRSLVNINHSETRVLKLQEQLATGQRVNSPSDDPLAARRAIDASSHVQKNTQYIANITTSSSYLTETESALTTVENILQRANELTLQGANDTYSQTDRAQNAIEINQLLENMLTESNHLTNDRFVFGGNRTRTQPFTATRNANSEITAVAYNGNDEKILVEANEDTLIPINETGEDIFLQTSAGTNNIFQTLINIRDHLRAGNTTALTTDLTELKNERSQVEVAISRNGSIQNRMDQIEENLRSYNLQLASVKSDNIDADYAELTVQLNIEMNSLQGALSVGARILQSSLLDYLG